MIDPASITTGISTLKIIKDTYSAITSLKIDAATAQKINDANTAVGEVQDLLYQLREELFRLQTENHELKKVIDVHDRWEEKMASYTLVNTEGGGTVFKSNGLPNHYMCPRCVNKQEIQILQHLMGDAHSCPGCGSDFFLSAPKPLENLNYRRLT